MDTLKLSDTVLEAYESFNYAFDRVAQKLGKQLELIADVGARIWLNSKTRKIASYLVLSIGVMFIEVIVGYRTNSIGLVSDAVHMLNDNFALVIGLVTSIISQWKPDKQYSYGYARHECLSAFAQSLLLAFFAVQLMFRSISRIITPEEIEPEGLMFTSILGLLVNIVGLFSLHEDAFGHSHTHHVEDNADHCNHDGHSDEESEGNDNAKGLYLHVFADFLGSISVVFSSFLTRTYNLQRADPICSLLVSLMILGSVRTLMITTAETLLLKTPSSKRKLIERIIRTVKDIPGVVDVQNAHIWRYCPGSYVSSLHLVVDVSQLTEDAPYPILLAEVKDLFKNQAGIEHTTVEIRPRI